MGESGSGKSVTVKSIFGMINFFPGIIGGEIKYHDPKGNEYVILIHQIVKQVVQWIHRSSLLIGLITMD